MPRAVNIQARERSLAEEATQRSSRVWKLKTSALALAGAVTIGGVPTQVEPPSDGTIAASSSAGAPLMQRSAELMHVEVVNSERQLVDLTAQASLGHTPVPASAPAAFGATQPAVGAFGATPVVAPAAAPPATASNPSKGAYVPPVAPVPGADTRLDMRTPSAAVSLRRPQAANVAPESQPQSGSTPPPTAAQSASNPASDGRSPATVLNPPEGASAAAVPVETPPPPVIASALPAAPNQPSSAPRASYPASDGRPPATALNPPEGAFAAAVPVETPPPPAIASALPTAPNRPSSATGVGMRNPRGRCPRAVDLPFPRRLGGHFCKGR